MKRFLLASAALIAFCAPHTALARNLGVEAALANYGDLSSFYSALLNSGAADELRPDRTYTVLAPTNRAFAEIRPDLYPCFYSQGCRAQLAQVVRDHIVPGRMTRKQMVREAELPTIGHYRVYAESPFVGAYTVADNRILSGAEINGNMVYRIDGVILTKQQLAGFRGRNRTLVSAPPGTTVTTYRSVTARYPAPGGMDVYRTQTVTERPYRVMPGTTVELDCYPSRRGQERPMPSRP